MFITAVSGAVTVVLTLNEGNNKASQLFRARMFFHSKPEPIRG